MARISVSEDMGSAEDYVNAFKYKYIFEKMNKRHLILKQNVQRKRRSSSLRRSSRKNSRKFSRRKESKKRSSRKRSSRKPSTSKSEGFSKSQIKEFLLSPYVPYVIALGTLLGTSIQANRNARERGLWECEKCGDLNKLSRPFCNTCNAPRPADV